MRTTMKSPKTASLLRRKRRQKPSSRRSRRTSIAWVWEPSLVTASLTILLLAAQRDARVYEGVKQVHQHVYQHHYQGDDQHRPLHGGVVPLENRLDHQAPQPRQLEDLLRYHQPAQETGDLQAAGGDEGDESVPDSVADDDNALGQPLREGSPDVVRAELLQEAAPEHPRQLTRLPEPRGEDRQNHGRDVGYRVLKEWLVARGWENPEVHGEDDDEHHPEPEVRDRNPAERESRAHVIDPRAPAVSREDASDYRYREAHGEGTEGELQRDRRSLHDQGRDRRPVDQGLAEVAPQHSPEPVDVLDHDRLVQAQPLPHLLLGLFRGLGAEDDGRRVPGDKVDHRETDDADDEEDRQGQEQPPDQEGHRLVPPRLFRRAHSSCCLLTPASLRIPSG